MYLKSLKSVEKLNENELKFIDIVNSYKYQNSEQRTKKISKLQQKRKRFIDRGINYFLFTHKLMQIIIFSIIPISFSGLTYLYTRPLSLRMFNWIDKIGMSEDLIKSRIYFKVYNHFPNWIIYNSPAFIWTFSFTMLLGIIWNYQIKKMNICILLIPMTLGITSEVLQKVKIINGTFDIFDLSLYALGGFYSLLLINSLQIKLNIKNHE